MNNSRIQITDDGSHTLYNNKVGENYHSSFGAIQESKHIFIDSGLGTVVDKNLDSIRVLEIGIGTGLNILLTYLWGIENQISVEYLGYEPFPISKEEISLLNYSYLLKVDRELFLSIHENIGKSVNVSNSFLLTIVESEIQDSKLRDNYYDVVFFDAFSPDSQPELWTPEVFNLLFNAIKPTGVLTTYSCKGTVKRALKEAGFSIEKLPGPPGKREFLRAWKKK
jgi:tRNA U34 5-methylaminomethyl-2-thiouridine-forming methyltransferase MnmC